VFRLSRLAEDAVVGQVVGIEVVDHVFDLLGRFSVTHEDGVVRVLNADLDGVRLTIRPELVDHGPGIAPSLNILPTADGTALWVIQMRFSRGEPDVTARADLISLADGATMRTVELPADIAWHHPAGDGFVTAQREMYDSGDGWTSRRQDDRTLWVDGDGRVHDVGPGAPIAATDSHVLRQHCPDDCELRLTDHTTQTDALIQRPAEGVWWPVGGPRGSTNAGPVEVTSPDGRYALVGLAQRLNANGQPERLDLVLIDLHNATAEIVHDAAGMRLSTNLPVASWSPDGQWIVIIGHRDLELLHLHTRDSYHYDQIVPDQHWVLSTGPAP
jgi:hypothetical protein